MRSPVKLALIAVAAIIALVLFSTVDSERPLKRMEKSVALDAS
jgi:hypothetical protein